MSANHLIPTPTSQHTVHPFTTPDTLSGSSPILGLHCRCGEGEPHPVGCCPIPASGGLSPEGQTALALAHQEQDARDGLCGPVRVESWIQDEETEETLPEDLLGGVTALRALTCPSEISEGGTEVLVSPGEALPALTFYLAYDSSGTRIGQPSGAAGLALSRALDELAETYRDLGELGWGEEAERLDEARADLHLLRVTLSGALTPAALAALTGLDSSDAEAIPRAAALLQRLQREALPSPTPAELARLMRAAVGAGRQEELAAALLAGDESRIHFLQLALLLPGAP